MGITHGTLVLPFRAYVQNVLEVLSNSTVCPRSFGPFYVVSNYMNWVKTSWTYSNISDIAKTKDSNIARRVANCKIRYFHTINCVLRSLNSLDNLFTLSK